MPHTKHQLQELLAAAGASPRHKWGQNFLIDLNLMRFLADAADIHPDDLVLEVGCGTGSLTQLLAARAGAVLAVEIDPTLARIAAAELNDFPNAAVLHADILASKHTLNPAVLDALHARRSALTGRLLLVANLPYDVAVPVMINLVRLPVPPHALFVTVQAELAHRMIAAPATKPFGRLAILLQATGPVALLRTLPPHVFWPTPKVNSAIVHWQHDPAKASQIANLDRLLQITDTLLHHRRKTIRHCLKISHPELLPLLPSLHIDPDARGETLTVPQFITLANLLPRPQ